MGVKVNTNFEQFGYRFRKLKHSRVRKAATIGFEYEIPIRSSALNETEGDVGNYGFYDVLDNIEYEGIDCPYMNFTMNDPFSKHGYLSHTECGGLEVCSPVFPTISMAKAHAKFVKSVVVDNSDVFYPRNIESFNDCGIHVHIGFPSLDEWVVDGRDAYEYLHRHLMAMLNRKTSTDFVVRFTGRLEAMERADLDDEYLHQGVPDGWDNRSQFYDPCDNTFNPMIRMNNPDGAHESMRTLENRMFTADVDLLEPAIEFSHSLIHFAREWCKRNDTYDYPFIMDWAEWLDKQTGYRMLRQTAPLHLIN